MSWGMVRGVLGGQGLKLPCGSEVGRQMWALKGC